MATLNGRVKIQVYTDAAPTNNPKSRVMDIDESFSDVSVDQFQPLLIQIPNLAVDQAINLNAIQGEKLVLLSDQTISVKLNGSATALQCKMLFLDGAAVTSLSISNASGSVANVRLGLGK